MLIGIDNFDLIVPTEVLTGPPITLKALECKLGWSIYVPNNINTICTSSTTLHISVQSEDDKVSELVSSWWRLESQATSRELAPSKDDQRALTILEKTTKHVDGRYEVGLLWKENVALPKNYAAAVSHFIKTKERLDKDEKLFELYSKIFFHDFERGFIRKIDLPQTGWLLPEHPVTKPKKLGEVRRVSNAAAKYQGVCLNDMLLTGPYILAKLVFVIFRFQEKPVPIPADIEAMYMQISVRPENRKLLQFLWRKDEAQMYEYMRQIFGQNVHQLALTTRFKNVLQIKRKFIQLFTE